MRFFRDIFIGFSGKHLLGSTRVTPERVEKMGWKGSMNGGEVYQKSTLRSPKISGVTGDPKEPKGTLRAKQRSKPSFFPEIATLFFKVGHPNFLSQPTSKESHLLRFGMTGLPFQHTSNTKPQGVWMSRRLCFFFWEWQGVSMRENRRNQRKFLCF